jgi:hypothetical protein
VPGEQDSVPEYRTPDPPDADAPGGRTAPYSAYLLRLWREGEQGPWHASLQEAGSTRRVGFPDVEHLMAYLMRLTAGPYQSAGLDAPEPEGPRRVAEEEPQP